ncbi:AfsR/SARP family transcriptional regulator [Nonomuraea antri]|uniref:AfsR/SARP family transcriptional regulator n=1 Tax=Nonomuraea antri TaxID=2730852 RepID=UPI001F41A787|nr:BTAD domain-containing putative transcriptional regulator [Nonomuraea antri]
MLEAVLDGRSVALGGVRQQTILAALLLAPTRTASMGRLVESLYGDSPPPTARSQVQICVSALRRMFAVHGLADLISTQSQGYTLQVPYERIDCHRFESLLAQAGHARDSGRGERAIAHYRAALGLWRGPALEGIDSRLVRSAVSRLTESRITANEECLELELAAGRHHELVAELTGLVAEHPLRERLRGQLMLALYRSGRRDEALRVFTDAERTMIDELGIEPNARLRQLESAIRGADPGLDLRSAAVLSSSARVPAAPRMLPTDIADFTGREGEVERIRRHVLDGDGPGVPIIAVLGPPGIGKTCAAVHASHTVAARFPDGQLFADLRGGVSRPISPMRVLERFLRVMGVRGTAQPDSLDARAEMFRALLGDRRMLMLLDDVSSESQILPLLPVDPGSAVIITSRSRLTGLPGVVHLSLDSFKPHQSVELLARIAGTSRMIAEPGRAEELAELCGQLPLALRIAGVRLAARPHWTIGQLADRLQDETRRLDELKHGDMGIRPSISLMYESVSEGARRLFRRLAILDTQVFSAWIAAALMDLPFAEARELLDDLMDAQLVERVGTGSHPRYRFHDLVRVFAREHLAADEPPGERADALARVLGGLLCLADAARRHQDTGEARISGPVLPWRLPDDLVEELVAAPMSWYERERPTLISGIRQAAQAGFVELCWGLAISAVTLFESSVYLDDWRETHRIALAVTRQADDRRGQAAILYSTGSLHLTERRFDDARRAFESAAALFGEVGDDQGMALVVRNLGLVHRLAGRLEEAVRHYEWALEIFSELGDRVAVAQVLHGVAELELEAGDTGRAQSLLAEALRLSRDTGNRRVEAKLLHRMGQAMLAAAAPARAEESFEAALAVTRAIGDLVGQAYALHGLGEARLRLGEPAAAGAALREALDLSVAANACYAEARILVGLAKLALYDERPEEAVTHLRRALAFFRRLDVPPHEARVLLLLGEAHRALGAETAAREARELAAPLLEKLGPRAGRRLRKEIDDLPGNPYSP